MCRRRNFVCVTTASRERLFIHIPIEYRYLAEAHTANCMKLDRKTMADGKKEEQRG